MMEPLKLLLRSSTTPLSVVRYLAGVEEKEEQRARVEELECEGDDDEEEEDAPGANEEQEGSLGRSPTGNKTENKE